MSDARLADAVFERLRSGSPSSDMAVARYSAAFESLWSDEWRESFGTQSTRLVIVWDGQPVGDRLLLYHLTPLDWALAVSHRALQDTCSEKDCDWSLHIVDLTFGQHQDSWAVRHAASLLDAMPLGAAVRTT